MATKKDKLADESSVETLHNGVRLTGNVVHGVDNKLSSAEQGMKARGELDENNNPIAPEVREGTSTKGADAANAARTEKEKATDIKLEEIAKEREQAGVGPIKVDETLYVGPLTATAIAAATGQEVSVKWEQAQPTTEDGCFWSFVAYHPSAKRETFKIDVENKEDPTKRTYLERTAPLPRVAASKP